MELQRVSTAVDTTVDMNVDGAVVNGTFREVTRTNCTGMACPDPPATNCTETTGFVGGEIEDVDLEHDV
jgi:hypothetical protein